MLVQPSKRSAVVYPNRDAHSTGMGHVADGRSTALCSQLVHDPDRRGDGAGAIVGVEVGQISDEELVRDAQLGDKRRDQPVVEMQAAREDQRHHMVQSGTTGVRSETATGPK
jgi:hypothetical protein